MHQRLKRRPKLGAAPSGNLWLRSDLRQPPATRAASRPATTSPVVRSWLTWTLFGALLVTTAAAGHGYLITEPKAPGSSSTTLTSMPAKAQDARVTATDYTVERASEADMTTAAANTGLNSTAETLRYTPDNASTLPALYALEDTQQQLILQVEAIQASNRAMLDRLEHLQAALAPEEIAALAP